MSEQETIKGKIRRIFVGTKEEMEMFAQDLCEKNGYYYEETYFETYVECLEEEGYREYIITDNDIYEVVETKNFEYNDTFDASENPDGTISFVLSYYNGGCSFGEAIGKALKNMENK